jgi:cytochrome P450
MAAAHAFLKLPGWLPHPGRASMMHAVDRLQVAVRELVTARRAMLAGGNDLLGRLVRASEPETGRPISDEQLIDNLIAFFITGFETTALALMWALYLLARAPDWESRMLEEIAQVLNGAAVTGAHIDRLVITQQILKETMRLYPPTPAIIRVAREDTTLEGERLAAGTLLIVSIYALHRNKKRWRDPDRFDPSRFAPGSDREIPRYQYLPFGAGPRICIGAALAMIWTTAMLATIIRAARFETVPEHVPMPDWRVSLRDKGGMPLRVWMRPAQSSRP